MEKAGKLISGALCWLIAAAAGVLGFYYAVLPGTLSAETFGTVTGNFCGARVRELSEAGAGTRCAEWKSSLLSLK